MSVPRTQPIASPPTGTGLNRAGAVVAAALDAIITMDAHGRVVDFNPAAETLFGWTRPEVEHRQLHELIIAPELVEAHRNGFQRFVTTGEATVLNQRLEVPAIRKGGSRIIVELVVTTIESDQGGTEFIGFLREVTQLREAQEKVRRSEQRYDAIARNSNRMLVLIEQSGESTVVTGERVLGYRTGTTLPRGLISLVHPDDVARAEAFFAAVPAGSEEDCTIDLRLRHHDDDRGYVLCEVLGEDFRDHERIGGLAYRIADVTRERAQQRALNAATLRMGALLERMSTGVLVADADGMVCMANPALLRMFGEALTSQTVVGSPAIDLTTAMAAAFTEPERYLAEMAATAAAGVAASSGELSLHSGRVVERDFIPLGSAEDDAGVVWAFRDVTERATQARRLEEKNQSLAELAALKNEFVAKVSHELRTPLTSVVSFSELLQDPGVGDLNEEQQQYLAIIDRNAHKLLRLIEDLLLMAKLESHTLTLAPGRLDGCALAREVIEDLGPRAVQAQVSVTLEGSGPLWLIGDRMRLEQVAANLLGNAINYTPAGGSIVVRSAAEGEDWVLTVSDTGVGIPEKELAGVFETFTRATTSAGTGHHGTGLGLPISRLIVEQHGGTLTATSQPGVGTTMTVRLPRGRR